MHSQIDFTPPSTAFSYTIASVRLGEFDMGGVLYHANYFHLYEQIREEFLQSVGQPYTALAAQSQHLTVVESYQSFLSPVIYGQALQSYLWTVDVKRSSFVFNYSIVEALSGKRLHQAWTKHVFVSAATGSFAIQSLPQTLREALLTVEGVAERG